VLGIHPLLLAWLCIHYAGWTASAFTDYHVTLYPTVITLITAQVALY